jgi:hypothetical protein
VHIIVGVPPFVFAADGVDTFHAPCAMRHAPCAMRAGISSLPALPMLTMSSA